MGIVYIGKCPDYSDRNIQRVLDECFEQLGGVGKYIREGMKVLVKPNLVMPKRPECAATTHPALVAGVCGIIARAGASAVIADSPGGLYNSAVLRALYSVCGMTEACSVALRLAGESTGTGAVTSASPVRLNYDTSSVEVDVPNARLIKKTVIIRPIAEADLVINLPKLKTHGQMAYSGAVKNMFGAVPGVLKAEYHFRMSDYKQFAEALVDVFLSAAPGLNIMDAVWGMDGEGPTAGDPKYMGVILAGEDAFETDLTALSLAGLKAGDVPYMKAAAERGLCREDTGGIEYRGTAPGEINIGRFRAPAVKSLKTISFFDKGMMKFAVNMLKPKPVFNYDICVGCGECSRVCPPGVIEMRGGKPYVDLDGCIRCFCCHELCPCGAVEIKRSLLIRMAAGRKALS
ncbi:MAG: DUF362 domain-containing protein [Eubacteriales bacterium]|nr:DUF362 domain-containing protein [Eubacteriales bacterium]